MPSPARPPGTAPAGPVPVRFREGTARRSRRLNQDSPLWMMLGRILPRRAGCGPHRCPRPPNSRSAPGSPADFGQPRPLLRPGQPPGDALRLSSPHPLPVVHAHTRAHSPPPSPCTRRPSLPAPPFLSPHRCGSRPVHALRIQRNYGAPQRRRGPRPTPPLLLPPRPAPLRQPPVAPWHRVRAHPIPLPPPILFTPCRGHERGGPAAPSWGPQDPG